MPESDPLFVNDTMRDLAETVAAIGIGITEFRDFVGRKIARQAMEEFGLVGIYGEATEQELEDVMGIAAVHGMILSIKSMTEPLEVEAAALRLTETAPEDTREVVGKLVTLMIPRGIDFQSSGFIQKQKWMDEFRLLKSTESES